VLARRQGDWLLILVVVKERDGRLSCQIFLDISFRNLNVNTPSTNHFESRIASYQHPLQFPMEPWVDALDLRHPKLA